MNYWDFTGSYLNVSKYSVRKVLFHVPVDIAGDTDTHSKSCICLVTISKSAHALCCCIRGKSIGINNEIGMHVFIWAPRDFNSKELSNWFTRLRNSQFDLWNGKTLISEHHRDMYSIAVARKSSTFNQMFSTNETELNMQFKTG